MVKVRMNTADVAAEVKCLRKLIGMRCSNIYDISPKTYVFKLANSSGVTESGESEKAFLLMESGVRLHTTVYARDKSNTPSGFTLKLRKHIRTRRLEDVRQLGYDRIVLFQFGLGDSAHYVILELYAQGNILLTDSQFTVLTLLRSHRDDDKGVAIMSRHRYPTEICRLFERTTMAKLQSALTSSKGTSDVKQVSVVDSGNNVNDMVKGKQASRKGGTLKVILGEALGYGPALSEHMILEAGLIPNLKVPKDNNLDDSTIEALLPAITKFEDWMQDIISGDIIPEGFILMQIRDLGKDAVQSEPGSVNQIYDEFCPILLNQFKTRQYVRFETFDAALDEFYSKIEGQRADQQQKAKQNSAIQKLNKIRQDQENRVQTLMKEVDHCVKMAELIEYNLQDVDAAILAVRVALAKGMNWKDLAQMVKEEKKSGNPVAGLIDKLYLERNCMTLLLSNNLDEMDDDEKTLPAAKVEVDLALSAHSNARRWYEMKKRQESKQEKTVNAHEKAFKAAERKTRQQLSQEKAVATISHIRKVHWFEKFNWFITSENYLVISGRDAQQNEMVVKRYMSKGDLYVHADLHGASSTVIKNHRPEQQVPPLTINQAGCFTVCHSQAWDSKIVTSAWWVYPHQVSKTAPTGEYLTVGSFMIRGKKNFLPPHPLIMGFGLLFRIDESSLGSHLNERRVRGEEMDDCEELSQRSDSESEKEVAREKSNEECIPTPSITYRSESEGTHLYQSYVTRTNEDAETSVDFPVEERNSMNASDKMNAFDFTNEKAIHAVSHQLEDLIDRALELGSTTKSGGNVGYNNSQVELVDDSHHKESKTAVRDKPYLSKAERRRLKKEQRGNDMDQKLEQENEPKTTDVSEQLPVKEVQTAKPASGKITRGQKGKLKKIKEKYADQDDEERSIRMALLASAGKVSKSAGEKPNEVGASAKGIKSANGVHGGVELHTNGTSDAPKVCYKCKKAGHLSRDCHEQPDISLDKHADNVTKEGLHANANNADKLDRVPMEEDDINEIGEEEKEKLNEVDYLTGNPLPSDILLYAVPVCGPYAALQSYKYRVKIVPGTAKKGKAAKTAMNLFSHMPESTTRERELMKACGDPELVAAIVGNVKIAAAGLSQLKQRQKKGKKNSKDL